MAKVIGRDLSLCTLGANAAWSDASGRGTAATFKDWEDRVVTALLGEARWQGGRRVQNHHIISSRYQETGQTILMYQFYIPADSPPTGTGTVYRIPKDWGMGCTRVNLYKYW